ncbi:hypothetical protein ACHAXS_000383 [Conticribra weissflogii]
MTKDPKTRQLELKQTDLIDRVVETLEFEVFTAKSKFTPLECKLLVKDDNGESPSGDFSYSSVVRMMLYLSGHPRPDIAYAVNCTAWYMCCPKRLHEIALKYIKANCDYRLILNPLKELEINAYPNTDFAGMYGHKKTKDQ